MLNLRMAIRRKPRGRAFPSCPAPHLVMLRLMGISGLALPPLHAPAGSARKRPCTDVPTHAASAACRALPGIGRATQFHGFAMRPPAFPLAPFRMSAARRTEFLPCRSWLRGIPRVARPACLPRIRGVNVAFKMAAPRVYHLTSRDAWMAASPLHVFPRASRLIRQAHDWPAGFQPAGSPRRFRNGDGAQPPMLHGAAEATL